MLTPRIPAPAEHRPELGMVQGDKNNGNHNDDDQGDQHGVRHQLSASPSMGKGMLFVRLKRPVNPVHARQSAV
ncbi:hypothetical protein [Teichococcus rhizosphaerae]|uniref:hypothetical protein n=1 Tax=Teichococcus rhizosphaerae TaxID=1335062 RepID=UPI00114538D7|nr:hypothetical protein [Pseudoroseomonas rhizosphaerae]